MAQPRLIPDPDARPSGGSQPPAASAGAPPRKGNKPGTAATKKAAAGKPAQPPAGKSRPAKAAPERRLYSRPSLAARLLRVVVCFVVIVSAYMAYALAVVPIIEPSAEKLNDPAPNPEPPPPPRTDVLIPYFPPDAWELKNPKILESERAMLLIQGYHNLPDGRVKLSPCTVVFFAADVPRDQQKTPPVILQAPEGAILKFDEPFDLKRAKIGRLVGGTLVGKVTIRRDASRPGAADDLRVTTRDVELTDDRVVTPHPVDFHFGPSYGSGREMTILLARNPPSADGKPQEEKRGLGIAGVKSFELTREVRMHMLLGGKDPQDLANVEKDEAPPRRSADPPVEVTCQGPFQFNLERNVATFNDQVDVLRLNANGPGDQLNCDRLSIFFVRRDQGEPQPKPTRPASKAPPATANLEARLVEARGNPVVVRSPSTGSQARCQRLEYDLRSGRVSLQGTGTLQGALPRNPAQKYQARWSKELRFEPNSTLPEAGSVQPAQMFSLVGGAHMRISDVGSRAPGGAPQPAALSAEEIHAWLEPPPPSDKPAPLARNSSSASSAAPGAPQAAPVGIGRAAGGDLRPKRLLAQGSVRMDSVPLSGSTGRLEAFFTSASAPATGKQADGGPNANRPGTMQPAGSGSEQQFRFAGSSVQVRFVTRGEQTDLADVLLEGNADLREAKTAKPDDKPLMITGDRLQLAGGDGPDSQIRVAGVPAYVEARGMSITGTNIQLERRSNRLWVDGAGKMTLPSAGTPRPDARRTAGPTGPQKLEIDWAGRMNFDGRSAVFERSIVAHTPAQLLRTERLEVTLKQKIDFANPPAPDRKSEPAQLDQIVCQGGAYVENRTWDERGLASIDRLQALDLAINDTTGGIDAHGPGWVSSVRRGVPAAAAPPGLPGSGTKPATKTPEQLAEEKQKNQDKLSYLNVNFARAITGNLHTRELTFADQVKTVYGPVAQWEQKLDADAPEALPPDGVVMTCDQLTVRETSEKMPREADRAERGFLELEAVGGTLVEGMGFTARAHRLTFAEKKSLLVLDGDGHSDAQLFRQPAPGDPVAQATARRILYWQATNRVEIDDARFFDFGQFNLGGKKPDEAAPADGSAKPNPKPKPAPPKRTSPARGGAAATH